MLASYTPFYRAVISALQKPVNRMSNPVMAYLIGASSTAQPSIKIYSTSNYSRLVAGAMSASLGPTIEYVSAFSPDDSLYVVGHNLFGGRGYTVYETTGWTVVGGTPSVAYPCQGCFFSPDGNYLALTFTTSPRLYVIHIPTWSIVPSTPVVVSSATDGCFSSNSSLLALSHSSVGGKNFTVIDTITWTIVTTPTMISVPSYGISFNNDGSRLMVSVFSNLVYMKIYDTSTWTEQPIPSMTLFSTGGGMQTASYNLTGDKINLYARKTAPHRIDKLITYNSADNTQVYNTPALKRFVSGPIVYRDEFTLFQTERNILVYNGNNTCVAELTPPTGSNSYRHTSISYNTFNIDAMNAVESDPQPVVPNDGGHIHDAVTNDRIMDHPILVTSSPHTSPSSAYTTWAATMGVDGVTSLPHTLALNDFNTVSATTLILNFARPKQGDSNIIVVGGNGSVNLIHNYLDDSVFNIVWDATTAWTTEAYGDVLIQQDDFMNFVSDDMYKGHPSALIHVGNHHLLYSVTSFKWNQNGDSVIIYMEYTDVNSLHNVQVAYRFMQTGHFDIVYTSSNFPRVKFTISTYDEVDYNKYYPVRGLGSLCFDVTSLVTHYKNHNHP